MPSLPYRIVDVFTDTPYLGNPLAVVFEADDLTDAQMQRIAREFNLSETVFVREPERAGTTARLRIFMPEHELPFAGHPTIGAAFALVESGHVAASATQFVLHETIGDIAIRLESRDPFLAWFETPPMTVGARADRETIARALEVEPGDLLDCPPEVVGAGNNFLFVALRTPEAVDRVVCGSSACRRDPVLAAVEGVFVFAPVAAGVYARMLAPLAGVSEDPATGSATGPLALYLTRHGLAPLSDGFAFVNEQGTRMGRRSLIHAKLHVRDNALRTAEIGGGAVPVMAGELRV